MGNLLQHTRRSFTWPYPSEGIDPFQLGMGGYFAVGTSGQPSQEGIEANFAGLVDGAFKRNAVVFAVALKRLSIFSEAWFIWQGFNTGKPGRLFSTPELDILEQPWPRGVTGDLLARMLVHADPAGNAYVARSMEAPDRLRVMRPDWVTIVMGSSSGRPVASAAQLDAEIIGFIYDPQDGQTEPEALPVDEVAHFAPIPDPTARFRGMSWMTPLLREIQGDQAATEHKLAFFANGAAQPYNAAMLTPAGWTRMEDIAVGSEVIGPDGKPRRVLGVYPQGEKDIYRLTFSDGATTECCEDHLWQVASIYDRKRGTSRLMTLRQIIDGGVRYPSGPPKWSIPLVDPIEYGNTTPLPLDPYLLGALLGDGSFRGNGQGSGRVSLAAAAKDADEMEAALWPLLPDGVTIKRRDRGGWSELNFARVLGGPRQNSLTSVIRDLGLVDVGGANKVIPEAYMHASVTERIALLQGLIDTDGYVNRAPYTGVTFTSISETLARQVRELALSLGGTASCKADSARGIAGRREQWRVYIGRLPEWIVPVRLARKRAAYRPSTGPERRHRYLRAVELVRRASAQCIKVDADDGLYVTDDFIVTHNTPQLVVSFDAQVKQEAFEKFVATMDRDHAGWRNAYKTLYLGGGADVTVAGKDLQQLDFSNTQGKGETRIAAAGGIHPVIAGLSEGLQGSSLNAGNFAAARRITADTTMRPLWRNVCGSLQAIVPPPNRGARLWYDESQIAFLREDAADRAQVQFVKAQTIRQLVEAGFTPESVAAAVEAEDMSLLVHSGMLSVQLQEPGAGQPPAANGNGKVLVPAGAG